MRKQSEGPAADGAREPTIADISAMRLEPLGVVEAVLVDGALCGRMHFNPPDAMVCRECRISMRDGTRNIRRLPRPPLGVLLVDDGRGYLLDRDYVIGREPLLDGDVAAGRATPLPVTDPEGSVSRLHLRVSLVGWRVEARDLGSANGSVLYRAGGPRALAADGAVVLEPGARVGVGRRSVQFLPCPRRSDHMSAWAVPGYTEERELGRGASARVVAATRNDTGQQVAIKYLAPRLLRDPGFLARFREEVELLASIDVPHVVRLFDYVEAPGEGAAIVMELVEGVSLHEMITRQGATSPESALVVLKGSLLGLAAAHQLGIVHRDYKPENVLVDGAGNSKLTDFGVAVKAGERAPVGGTPLYMAPEQWNGEPATPATDIYAATAVFFECLTGQTPFSGRLERLAMQHQTAAIPVGLFDRAAAGPHRARPGQGPEGPAGHAVEFVAELNSVADAPTARTGRNAAAASSASAPRPCSCCYSAGSRARPAVRSPPPCSAAWAAGRKPSSQAPPWASSPPSRSPRQRSR